MPSTSIFGLPYPNRDTDYPDGPLELQQLAEATEAALAAIRGQTSNRPRQTVLGLAPGGVTVLPNGSGGLMSQDVRVSGPCVLGIEANADCYNAVNSNVAGYMQLYVGAQVVRQIRMHWHGHAGFLTPSGYGELYVATAGIVNLSVHTTSDPDSQNGYTPFDCSYRIVEYPAV